MSDAGLRCMTVVLPSRGAWPWSVVAGARWWSALGRDVSLWVVAAVVVVDAGRAVADLNSETLPRVVDVNDFTARQSTTQFYILIRTI